MKGKKLAAVFMVAAMIIFGTLGLFVRNIPLPSGELALYRAAMATVLVGGFLLFTGRGIALRGIKKDLPFLLLSGAAMGINWILLFEAYKYTTISMATLSYYFAPVIVTVVCPFLFQEKLRGKQLLCFVMSTVGMVLIIGVSGGGGSDLKGIMFGLSAAVFYATVILLNKFIKDVDGLQRTFWQFLAAVLVLRPYVGLTGGFHWHQLDSVGWMNLLVVGLVHTGLTYCMYFSALKELPGQQAAILSYIDPLVAVLVSIPPLGNEPMTPWQLLGGVLILGFTLLNEIPTKNKRGC